MNHPLSGSVWEVNFSALTEETTSSKVKGFHREQKQRAYGAYKQASWRVIGTS